jgi:hypothetical protein
VQIGVKSNEKSTEIPLKLIVCVSATGQDLETVKRLNIDVSNSSGS